jgi:hypothetical protein
MLVGQHIVAAGALDGQREQIVVERDLRELGEAAGVRRAVADHVSKGK